MTPSNPLDHWFADRGWQPFEFQRDAWAAYRAGGSGLIHAATGTGKTLAAWLGPVGEAIDEAHAQGNIDRGDAAPRLPVEREKSKKKKREDAPALRVLWLTPLRALAADTEQNLRRPLEELGLNWTLESRTGDTSSAARARQKKQLPTALLTTPESLCLQLSYPDAADRFASLRCVVVDEWHELLGSKRGSQTELALARLRRWRPGLRVWGLSATLGNLPEALAVLTGSPASATSHLISAAVPREYRVDTLIPHPIERFPWAGHLGLRQVPAVVAALDDARTAIVFTNTRAQTELWYQSLLRARPEWAGTIALHHGSLDRATRAWVEDGLREGRLRCVVSTSSLDLGVDFSPVDRVFQVGSPKGVGRLLQRAGRSGHRPGEVSRVTCVPTHALELVEIAAARDALAAGRIEARVPPDKPLDVLAQHAVALACGGGFTREELLTEVRTARRFAGVTDDEWDWVLDFITRGGPALRAYPEYRRVTRRDDGVYVVDDPAVARRHRLNIGTITSDAGIEVRFLRGARLGTIEEGFLSRLGPGDRFTFAGRTLELVKVFDMKAWVRKATGPVAPVPRWQGGRMPLSTELSAAVRDRLDAAARGVFDGPEMTAARGLLELQAKWSRIPAAGELLIETLTDRDGHHLFCYPFAGCTVHEGLATLVAYRLSRRGPISFGISVNDYGFELLSPTPAPLAAALAAGLLDPVGLEADLLASLNGVEMAKRQFREIARVAGLVAVGHPGGQKTARQLQASSGLLFDVFQTYDPDNLLLRQARREVLSRQLDAAVLGDTLRRLADARVVIEHPRRPTPLAFPLLVDRLRERLSSEKLADRVRRLSATLERAAGP